MPSRSAHRPRPTVATLVAVLLLACGFLMWGAGTGHAGAISTSLASSKPAMTPAADGMAGMADMSADELADEGMDDHCPSMAMDCPLASAPFPASAALAAPVPTPLPQALGDPAPAAWSSAVECARPRAPDPEYLLCVSRT